MPIWSAANDLPGVTGASANFTCNRDKLILLAHKLIGVIEEGQALSGDQIDDGINLLGLIVREQDAAGRWRWTVGEAKHLSLAANVCRYSVDNGLPRNIAELLEVHYRNAYGKDTRLNILKAENYERIEDKMQAGEPCAVYLSENMSLANRVLFVWPLLSSVVAESIVGGDVNGIFKCIYPHTGATVNRPTNGPNWPMMWEEIESGASVSWVNGTTYSSAQQLRLVYRRPIADFDSASDIPDFPLEWPRQILYRLAFDLADMYGIPGEERQLLIRKAQGAADDIAPMQRNKSNTKHNKARYF
jgi:hypothetical protein